MGDLNDSEAKLPHSTCTFGLHLTIDGYGGNPLLLDNEALVKRLLIELPDQIGMHRLHNPVVLRASGGSPKDPGGWSGVVVIWESHISLHTFPARGFISADVYTCSDCLNIESILSFFREMFALKDIETNLIQRGTRYPMEDIKS